MYSRCFRWFLGPLAPSDNACQIKAEAAGRMVNFNNLPDHNAKWLNIVNNVVFVMDKAQNCDVPTRGMPSPGHRTKRKL